MSIKLMTAVWDRQDLSSTQKLVLLSLADWANDEGLCWPSIDRLAIKTSMAGRSVQRIIRDLESMGFVRRDEVLGKGNRYWISMPLTECHPCHSVTPPLTQCHPTPDTVSPNTPKIHQLTTKYIRAELPDCIPADAWNGWVEMRKQRKKPLTDRAYNQAIDKLAAFMAKGQNITEVLDRSTMNGWTDLYEIKEQKNGTTNRTTGKPRNENGFAAALRYVADGRPDDPF
jgi:DNA-binding transcriptional regulator YhcF (GntR family)